MRIFLDRVGSTSSLLFARVSIAVVAAAPGARCTRYLHSLHGAWWLLDKGYGRVLAMTRVLGFPVTESDLLGPDNP